MSAHENHGVGGATPPGDPFPRAVDIFDREAFAIRLADARRRRERILAQRAAVSQPSPLRPAVLPEAARAIGMPPGHGRPRRRLAIPTAIILAILAGAALLLWPGGATSPLLPRAFPAPALLEAPVPTRSTPAPLPGDRPAAPAPTRPQSLIAPQTGPMPALFDAAPWVPRPLARPEGLKPVPTLRRRKPIAEPPVPATGGIERLLGRMGIRPVSPRPAGQRNPRD